MVDWNRDVYAIRRREATNRWDYDVRCLSFCRSAVLQNCISLVSVVLQNCVRLVLTHQNDDANVDLSRSAETERKILQGFIDYRGWSHTGQAKDFIQDCCCINSGRRMSSAAARKHPWIEKTITKKNLPNELVASFDLFRLSLPLKRLALNVLAKKSPPSQYRGIWEHLDSTESGTLTRDEFMDGFKNTGSSPEELADLFIKLDVNCNGEILYTEFLAATLENLGEIEEAQIREAFDLISKDGKKITKKDVQKVLGSKQTNKVGEDLRKGQIDSIFKSKEKIDYESFASLFEHGYTVQVGMDAIMETSLNAEQFSQLKEDDRNHLSSILESYGG